MKNIIILDLKNILRSNKFKIMTIVIMIIPILAFLMSCNTYYGIPTEFIRSAMEENFINGIESRHIKIWFILILPLLSMLICSDIYSDQYNNGVYKNILIRCSKRQYILSKVIVVFIVTFNVILISLIFNQLLSLIAFPLQGMDNSRMLPSFDIGYFNYRKDRFLDMIRIKNLYFYNFLYIIIFAFIGALYSLVGLSVSFFIRNSKISIIGMFIAYLIIYKFFSAINKDSHHINMYLDGSTVGNNTFIFWISAFILSIVLLTILKLNSADEV